MSKFQKFQNFEVLKFRIFKISESRKFPNFQIPGSSDNPMDLEFFRRTTRRIQTLNTEILKFQDFPENLKCARFFCEK